jgi:hypothetical protein
MKAPTLTPVYVAIYAQMAEAARSCGYALAVHGTLGRDLDVIAIPWTEEATSPEEVVRVMAETCARRAGPDLVVGKSSRVGPHGRMGYAIPFRLGGDDPMDPGYVDVSVMPRSAKETP